MSSRRAFLAAALAAGGCGTEFANRKSDGMTRFAVSTRRLTLRHTWTIARGSSDFKDNVFVRIERNGIVGWGEAAPHVRYSETPQQAVAALENAGPILESSDWFHYVDLRQQCQPVFAGQTCVAAALDMAVLDWVCRSLNVPLWRLLGLDKAKAPLTTFSIGIDTPDVVRRKVAEAADYPVLKIKVGRDNDAEILAAVRDATDRPLRVDANEAWTDRQVALEKIRWLAGLGVELIEQPMPADRIDDTAWLHEQTDMPIIADEAVKTASDIPKLAGAYDGINIKLAKSGGIQEALRMIHLARTLGLKVMLGCMIESSLGISAAAQISPLVDWADLDGNLLIDNDPFVGVGVANGRLVLSDEPGLGARERRV